VSAEQPVATSIRFAGTRRHVVAYGGLLLFTVVLYLRPNELLPIGTFPLVKIIALGTLAAFFIERLSAGRALSVMPRPFKYLLGLALFMVLSIPFGFDPGASFAGFTDVFLKVLLVFLLIINVVTSFHRLRLMMETLVLSGAFVAVATLLDYAAGRNLAEGFRAAGAVGGIFGNPNDLALAMNVLIPLAVGLTFIRPDPVRKLVYLVCTGLFIATVIVTYSRAGFLTLTFVGVFLTIQLGRRYPSAWGIGGLTAAALVMASPGTFWNRILTIFEGSGTAGGSAAESATARWGLVKRSIEVAGANPIRWLFGVGVDNFHFVSNHELVNHNAYLQVFNEVGLPAMVLYILFLAGAVKITAHIGRRYVRVRGYRQVWLTAVAVEASLIAYIVGSFFASVAYLWYVYYPAGFAVCLQYILARAQARQRPRQEEVAPRVWYLRRVQH
jgi:hypothetical protein